MKFIDDLYLGPRAAKKEKRLIKKIKKGSFFSGAYVICLPEDSNEPLEYIDSRFLSQDYYKRHEPLIIGIAADEDEAMELVNDIIKDCMEKTGSLNVRCFTEELAKASGYPVKEAKA